MTLGQTIAMLWRNPLAGLFGRREQRRSAPPVSAEAPLLADEATGVSPAALELGAAPALPSDVTDRGAALPAGQGAALATDVPLPRPSRADYLLERLLLSAPPSLGTVVLGIDVSRTGIEGALVDVGRGELVGERLRVPTPQAASPEAVAAAVVQFARHFDWRGPIGCAFPAVVKGGVVRTASNVDPAWVGVNGQTLLAQATGCPLVMLNDADAAGIAEMAYGAGAGCDGVVLMVTFGTGIGTALFVDRRLVPNTELGHLELRGKAAERRAAASVRQRKGWGWRRWARQVNEYLLVLERLLAPDLFILGGGVSKKSAKFFSSLTLSTPVVAATLLDAAGIVGAARAASALLPPEPAERTVPSEARAERTASR